MKSLFYRFLILFLVLFSSNCLARDFIRIVGSATIYPFSTLIVENFSKTTSFSCPVVEANGTGGGFSQFCKGVGFSYPDINDASRKMTNSERILCNKNGINNPLEIKIGYDGITIIYPKGLGKINLTIKDLFLAIAAKVPSKENPTKWVDNFYTTWNEINPSFPNKPIKLMGPPSTSGTRDTVVELILKNACEEIIGKKLGATEKKLYCGLIRRDGAWLDGTENYSLVLQKVSQSCDLFAIMGYDYYKMNAVSVLAANINNVTPTFHNIANGSYPLSRPLYMYVKKEHLEAIPGLKEFVKQVVNKKTLGEDGFLASHGLIPLSDKEYKEVAAHVYASLPK